MEEGGEDAEEGQGGSSISKEDATMLSDIFKEGFDYMSIEN